MTRKIADKYLSDRVYDGVRKMSPEERKAHRERVKKMFYVHEETVLHNGVTGKTVVIKAKP